MTCCGINECSYLLQQARWFVIVASTLSPLSSHVCSSLRDSLCSSWSWSRGSISSKLFNLIWVEQRFCLIEPKVTLSNSSNSELHLDIRCITHDKPLTSKMEFHALETMWRQSFDLVHIASNREIYFLCSGPMDKRIGMWLEYATPWWNTSQDGFKLCQSLLATKRSNHSLIR